MAATSLLINDEAGELSLLLSFGRKIWGRKISETIFLPLIFLPK